MIRFLLIALILAFLGLSGRLFVFPRTDSPRRADAVIVLAGAQQPRLNKGLELMRKKVAPPLVISDGRAPGWPEANRLCVGRATYKVVCFKPEPYSTRGEAEHIAELVDRNRWRSIVVVTSIFHVTRARLLIKRCVDDARVYLVGADYALVDTPRYVLSEWGKYFYAQTVKRGC